MNRAERNRRFKRLRVNVTANDSDDQALLQRFGIFGPPTISFFVSGQEQQNYRVVGYMKAEQFAPHATAALNPGTRT